VKPSTLQVYAALQKHVESFIDEKTTTSTIGPGFLRDFQRHLVAGKAENSTVNKYTTRFRGFLAWLHETGDIAETPTAKTLSTIDDDVVRLDLAELEALRTVNLTARPAGHRQARDLFLFSCYTGLRFGDCRALTWDNVGEDAVFVAESKTNHFRRIPLTRSAREILNRYEGKKAPLPALSNQKANDAIKEVAALAGITAPITKRSRKGGKIASTSIPKHEALSMHDGRRTFVSLMLESGVSTKELLGVTHSDLRALQRYAAASESHLRQAMDETFDPASAGTG
jgi:site-specific recombinase XerD